MRVQGRTTCEKHQRPCSFDFHVSWFDSMIYVLGVNDHRYQAINPRNNPHEDEFRDFVLEQVKAKKIDHLAEEMNDEYLQRENDAQESVCRKMANDLEKTHTMCEPNTQDRQQIGYIDKSWEAFIPEVESGCNETINAAHSKFHRKQWHLREEFWFRKLQPYITKNTLFVCGANHADRFSTLLESKGIKNKIIQKRWKPREEGNGQSET